MHHLTAPLRRALLFGTLAIAAFFAVSASAHAATFTVGSAASGDAAWLTNPDSIPAGVNNWSCKPSAAHPEPVVLVPGTTSTVEASFASLGPILANAGYCVYGLNYGDTELTTLTHGTVGAVGDIPTSAGQLATFVTQVLASTGASKVDIVGWSQGGMMPRYYLKYLGGAAKVDHLVGLAPSNHGTTLFGLLSLISWASSETHTNVLSLAGCPACSQQNSTSSFITNLNAGGETVAGVKYTVIESIYDDIVTPYTSAFLNGANVTNITLQQQCPFDASDHFAMDYDANAIQDVLNALAGGSASFRPTCYPSVPFLGTVGIAAVAGNFS